MGLYWLGLSLCHSRALSRSLSVSLALSLSLSLSRSLALRQLPHKIFYLLSTITDPDIMLKFSRRQVQREHPVAALGSMLFHLK